MKTIALRPTDVYPAQLNEALTDLGTYVYAYYRPDENPFQPFYIGKGQGSRGLSHWKKALDQARLSRNERTPIKQHEEVILELLERGLHPEIKILAYNLDKTNEDRYSLVERVLLDAFGIQKVWEKQPRHEKEVGSPAILLQSRNESSRTPVLSLDAVLARADLRRTDVTREDLPKLVGVPVLTVGTSKTYHPSYTPELLSEMARRYWTLKTGSYKNRLPQLRENPDSALLAWSSELNGQPMVVGAWRIVMGSIRSDKASNRESMTVSVDNNLRKRCIGLRLAVTGNSWQGAQIHLP